MHTTYPTHLIIPLDLIILVVSEEDTNYEALHFAVFSNLLSLLPRRSKYFLQYPVRKHPQCVVFP
jgi:hypothetical protein